MDAPTAPSHTCLYCGSNFTKRFNLKRHMIRIHKISEEFIESNFTKNVSHLPINSHPKTKNVSQITKNVSHTINKDILTETCNDLECNKCGKTFSRKWYLNIHSQPKLSLTTYLVKMHHSLFTNHFLYNVFYKIYNYYSYSIIKFNS
jgi:hypothetical protein